MSFDHVLSSLAALGVAVCLVLILGRVARAVGFARPGAVPAGAPRPLALRDTIALDARRRVFLLACDGQQVIVLTGGATDVLAVLEQRRTAPGDGAP